MNRPKRRRNIPLNFVRPSKQQKRIKVNRVSASLPSVETVSSQHVPSETDDEPDACPSDDADEYDLDGSADVLDSMQSSDVSSHTKRKERAAAKWDEIHQNALTVMIEESSLPSSIKCFVCGLEDATVRCLYCGPQHFFCATCAVALHSEALYHHCPEVWKDGCYIPLDLPIPLVVELKHDCETVSRRVVTCYHIDGIPRNISFPFCTCESDCIKLIRLHYWPATSSKPLIAFTFQFLDWLEALLLECQVAVQDMTQAISYLIKEKLGRMPCQLYPVLIDSFEEYRHAKHRVCSLETIVSVPLKAVCPACPKGNGTVTVAIDALFGLCRKKAAGHSVRSPLSGVRMFEPQAEVNAFVDNYEYTKATSSKGCNNFLAGDALRSKTRFKALDETGVMGTVCRHEVPIRFFNLHHGERISYAVFLMKKLKQHFPNHDVQLMYDIACLLHKHIEAHLELKREFGDFFKLAIPIFHCYGHKLQCQIQLGPRNLEGFGLSDGEGMERMWSYLRRFSRMTKEMRPSHRIDVLTDAIVYYAQKSILNMGTILDKRMQRAHKLQGESSMKLDELMKASPESFTMEDVEQWLKDENSKLSLLDSADDNVTLTWQEEYVKHVDSLSKLHEELRTVGEDDSGLHNKIAGQIALTEKKLKTIESKHHLSQRWVCESVEYQLVKETLTTKIRNNLLAKIKDLARERWFLLALKAKYADGLALACRLSKRITAVSSQIKKMITDYNKQEGEPLTWQAAIDLHYPGQEHEISSISVSHEIMRQAVGHLRHLKRSKEEIVRLRCEMKNCLTFYQDKIEQLENIQQQLTRGCITRLNLGSLNLVKKQLRCDGNRLHELQQTFSRWISINAEHQPMNHLPNHHTPPPSSSIPAPPLTLSTQPCAPSRRVINLTPSSSPFVPHNPLSRVLCESSSSSDAATTLSTDLCTTQHVRGHTQHSTSNSCSIEHQPMNILPSLSSNHNTSPPSSLLSPPTLSTQPPSPKLFNFTPSSSPFLPRRFLYEPKSFFKSSSSLSDSATRPHPSCLQRSDTVTHPKNTKQSLSGSFQGEYHSSIREPETGKQQSEFSGCSDDDESSGEEEELPNQYWRAERFHMEEFLKQMRAKELLTLDTMLSESDRSICITTTKEPAAAVMRPASFLKKKMSTNDHTWSTHGQRSGIIETHQSTEKL